jgi:tRNA(Ser,Leu) C12 N-acetylase TAN1
MVVEDDPQGTVLRRAEKSGVNLESRRQVEDDEFGLGLRTPPWNVIVTARTGYRRKLRRGLGPLLRLRRSAYPNVLTGLHEDPQAFLDSLDKLLTEKPYLATPISRFMTVERAFPVDPPGFAEQLEVEIEPFLERLANKTFHVRLERRGHKGRIHSKDCEISLGGHIYERFVSQGLRPSVKFADPDIVVVVEIIDDPAGKRHQKRDDRRRDPQQKND